MKNEYRLYNLLTFIYGGIANCALFIKFLLYPWISRK